MTMDFLTLAQKRVSVRGYLPNVVEDALVTKVLKAGLAAPSACNNQPWVFIVISDEHTRLRFEKVYNRPWFLNAPVILAACCDRDRSWKRSDGKDFGDIDVAIAVDHMTLAAAECGLGTCWVGAFNVQEARKLLLLPNTIDVIALTPLGYPAPDQPQKSRKSLEEVVHWDFYGGKKRLHS